MTSCDVTPWKDLLADGTSLWDGGAGGKRGVRFKPSKDRRGRLFTSDDERFRKRFGNKKSCDGIFLIEWRGGRRLVFVELKGRNVEDGVEQLIETLQAVRRQLPANCRKTTIFEARIIRGRASPSQVDSKMRKAFERKTDVALRCHSVPRGGAFELE